MDIKIFQFNPVGENTYVLHDETGECVIIDPGCLTPTEEQTLGDFVAQNSLTVVHLLNTHLHFDHIFGNAFVESRYNLKTEANQLDEFLVEQLPNQLKMFGFNPNQTKKPTFGRYLLEGDQIQFGNQTLDILHVPGHSPGSIVFYNKKQNVLVVGDVLFEGSIGRTDLPGGDLQQLISGIKTKLLVLPAQTVVYSGHGNPTTIGDEKQYNGYLR